MASTAKRGEVRHEIPATRSETDWGLKFMALCLTPFATMRNFFLVKEW
jgi:hypothetical protein